MPETHVPAQGAGTPSSSRTCPRKLSIQSIKTERAFVTDIDTNPKAEQFLRALHNLGRDLDIAMVVEGVERQQQADALRRLGCNYAQGHLFGRPAPAADIELNGITS